jgi:glyoxylase-like metal-dependent hydrolase (beta-lactamase superfamily II)
VKLFVLTLLLAFATAMPASVVPEYSIEAIRFANSPGDAVADLVMGAPEDEKVDTVYLVWLIRGNGRNILFDSGFHRARWFKLWTIDDYLRPDEAVRLAGVAPDEITDVIISHAHWDHMGGIDLFPNAAVWIQREEFRYYSGEAWQPGGDHGGIDPDDVRELVRINIEGRLRLVDGDDQEIIPGIRIYTGARHTYSSQYLRVDGNSPVILASDNVYLYRNLTEQRASATFSDNDHAANVAAQQRMIEMAGSMDRVVPGHDALQIERFPTKGRITRIR